MCCVGGFVGVLQTRFLEKGLVLDRLDIVVRLKYDMSFIVILTKLVESQ